MLQQKKTSHTKEENSEEMDGPLPKIAVFQKTKLHTGANWPLFENHRFWLLPVELRKRKANH